MKEETNKWTNNCTYFLTYIRGQNIICIKVLHADLTCETKPFELSNFLNASNPQAVRYYEVSTFLGMNLEWETMRLHGSSTVKGWSIKCLQLDIISAFMLIYPGGAIGLRGSDA